MKKCSFLILTFFCNLISRMSYFGQFHHASYALNYMIWMFSLKNTFLFNKYLLISYVEGIALNLRQILCISQHHPTLVYLLYIFLFPLPPSWFRTVSSLSRVLQHFSFPIFFPIVLYTLQGDLTPSQITPLLCFRIRT